MRLAILLGAFLMSAPTWAMQVSLTCFAKAYACGPDQNGQYVCDWVTLNPSYQDAVPLVKDNRFPSAQYPYNVYRARYQNAIDNHFLTIDFVWSDQDANHPLMAYGALDAGTVVAETSGMDRIDVSLHNQNFGRGFLCTNFQVVQ